MYIQKIKLENFRNYKKAEIKFDKNINIIYGDNAQGKTNILESIFVCSLGKSFRTNKDKELINKEKDLIFVSEPSDDILKSAEDNNVEFEMVGIGLDGFVFLVNKENKVDSLTLEQIQKIYTGEITNWSSVGGEDAEIIAYQREANSGSQNLMEKMVMQGLKMKKPENTNLMIGSMSGLIDGIASYSNSKNSIGYSIYLYAKEQYIKDNVKFLAINGVKPTDETIANRSYPLTKVVYAVYRKDEAQNSNVIKLVNWLKTEEGKKAVSAGGYVPLAK